MTLNVMVVRLDVLGASSELADAFSSSALAAVLDEHPHVRIANIASLASPSRVFSQPFLRRGALDPGALHAPRRLLPGVLDRASLMSGAFQDAETIEAAVIR